MRSVKVYSVVAIQVKMDENVKKCKVLRKFAIFDQDNRWPDLNPTAINLGVPY